MQAIIRIINKVWVYGLLYSYREVLWRCFGISRIRISLREYLNYEKECNGIYAFISLFNLLKFVYFRTNYSFANQKVLEVGGSKLPYDILFNKLKVSNWTCVDYLEYWNPDSISDNIYNNEFIISPLDKDSRPFHDECSYLKYHGDANDIPDTFNEQFDSVVSINCFEHIFNLEEVLIKCYKALKSGGVLYAHFSPIWSSQYGHHYFYSDEYNFTKCQRDGIPPYIHLLHSEEEIRKILVDKIPDEAINNFCRYCFQEPPYVVNKLFFEDYEKLLANSLFSKYTIIPFTTCISSETKRSLSLLYPSYRKFNANGMFIVAYKK